MNKKVLFLCISLLTMILSFSSCNKSEEKVPEAKVFQNKELNITSGGNTKNAQVAFNPISAKSATIIIKNYLVGASEVKIENVLLTEKDGKYSFSGMTKINSYREVKISGTIDAATMSLEVETINELPFGNELSLAKVDHKDTEGVVKKLPYIPFEIKTPTGKFNVMMPLTDEVANKLVPDLLGALLNKELKSLNLSFKNNDIFSASYVLNLDEEDIKEGKKAEHKMKEGVLQYFFDLEKNILYFAADNEFIVPLAEGMLAKMLDLKEPIKLNQFPGARVDDAGYLLLPMKYRVDDKGRIIFFADKNMILGMIPMLKPILDKEMNDPEANPMMKALMPQVMKLLNTVEKLEIGMGFEKLK